MEDKDIYLNTLKNLDNVLWIIQYGSSTQGIKYYKFFRYCPKYNMLELVSDYYNKIPLFFHLSDGIYEKNNGIEIIKGIDD